MSTDEAVESYLKGAISRRIFVRRLIAAGVGLNAAVAYSELLTPEWALASHDGTDHYGNDLYNEDLQQPLPQPETGTQTDGPPPEPRVPEGQQERREDPPPFVTDLKISKASLAAVLLTGRLVVLVSSSLPGTVTLSGLFRPAGKGSKKPLTLKGPAVQLPAPAQGRRVTFKIGRSARRVMRRRGGKLVVTATTASSGRGSLTKSVAVTLAGRRR